MNQQTSLNLNVLLKFRDYWRANFWFLFKTIKWLIPIAILVLSTTLYSWAQNPGIIPWLGFVLPAILLFVCLSTFMSAKRSMASNRSLQGNINYTFSDDGIDADAVSSSGHTDWENVYQTVETKHNFLIFISRNQMYTLPKRCFTGEEQMKVFRNLLQHHLPEKTKLKS